MSTTWLLIFGETIGYSSCIVIMVLCTETRIFILQLGGQPPLSFLYADLWRKWSIELYHITILWRKIWRNVITQINNCFLYVNYTYLEKDSVCKEQIIFQYYYKLYYQCCSGKEEKINQILSLHKRFATTINIIY